MMDRRVYLVGIAVLALLLLGLVVAAGTNTPTAQGDPPEPPEFTILTAGGEPSEGLVEQIPAEVTEFYGLDLEAAVAEEAASGVEVAVVPGDEAVCIVTATAHGCGTWLDAGLGRIALAEACSPGLDPGEVRVTGLLPDGAATAQVTRPPAAAVNVSAPLNVFAEIVEGDPATITSTGLAAPAAVPWDAADESLATCDASDEGALVYDDTE